MKQAFLARQTARLNLALKASNKALEDETFYFENESYHPN
jgi:hypothetical protein